jgi:hypothetical protein
MSYTEIADPPADDGNKEGSNAVHLRMTGPFGCQFAEDSHDVDG